MLCTPRGTQRESDRVDVHLRMALYGVDFSGRDGECCGTVAPLEYIA